MTYRWIYTVIVLVMGFAYYGCVATPVPVEPASPVEHSYSTDPSRNKNGVALMIQNTYLHKKLAITDVALVQGEYVKQFRARLTNKGSSPIQVTAEPLWYDHNNILDQRYKRYSHKQLHTLQKGQSKLIFFDAISHAARTLDLLIDCPGGECKAKGR